MLRASAFGLRPDNTSGNRRKGLGPGAGACDPGPPTSDFRTENWFPYFSVLTKAATALASSAERLAIGFLWGGFLASLPLVSKSAI